MQAAQELIPHIAYDSENMQAHGPFATYQEAVDWAADVCVATGEWDARGDVGRSTEYDDLGAFGWQIIPIEEPANPSAFAPPDACHHCGEARFHDNHRLLPPTNAFHAFEEGDAS